MRFGTIHKRRVLAALLVLWAPFAACSCSPSSEPRLGVDAAATEGVADEAVFSLVADVINGGSLSLDDELSTMPVALWFWAPG